MTLPIVEQVTAQGLVICAKKGRTQVTAPPAVPAVRFPSGDLVGAAAATLDRTANPEADRHFEPGARVGLAETLVWDGSEGPRWFITIAPGMVQVGSTDLARGERTIERRERARHLDADMLASWSSSSGELPPAPTTGDRGVIQGWSRKSRANMVRTLLTLDYSRWIGPADTAAMVTLTYPADWLTVAPNGRVVKRVHWKAFCKRWARRWGPLCCIWKLEFQKRGAPHFHFLTVVPAGVELAEFRAWVAATWADVVDHPDPIERMKHEQAGTAVDVQEGGRMTDPKRIGAYFTKHGGYAAKEYQNEPPAEWIESGESVGRFWGVMGLEPAKATVPVSREQALVVSRTLRRWQRQNRYQRPTTVVRVEQATGRIRYRSSKKWVTRMPGSAGFVAVNDGPSVAVFVGPREGHVAEFESGAREKVVGKWGGRWKPALPVELAAAGSAVVALPARSLSSCIRCN